MEQQQKIDTVPSPRWGFGGLSPQEKLQATPSWSMKHYKSFVFANFYSVNPPTQTQSPPIENFLATVLNWYQLIFALQLHIFCFHREVTIEKQIKQLMSNPNGLLSQKVCHYLNQGRTLNDILMRATHWMAYFDLSKLNLTKAKVLKAFESLLQW